MSLIIEKVLESINLFIKSNTWCDFEFIELKGDLKIGGKTGFDDSYNFIITFTNVFFIQCLYEWKTEVQLHDTFFSIANTKEQELLNGIYEVTDGNFVFKIIGEYVEVPMYIIAEDITVEFS